MFESEDGILLGILKFLEERQGLFVVAQASLYSIACNKR
jgi:hypothetical protein